MPRPPQSFLARPISDQPRLYFGGQASLLRSLVFRALLVFGLGAFVVVLFWLERDGLKDAQDGHISLIDAVYFAAVTLTTTGYGDIVPISERARLIDSVIITPVRLAIWMVFFGTAYQLVFEHAIERFRMWRRQTEMQGHVVICGFDTGGQSAAAELVSRGHERDHIVVVDRDEDALRHAAELGYVGLRGDATREAVLLEARVETARAIIVTVDRDDATVLTVLTARSLAPQVRILAWVREFENEKLIRQSGADVTVLPGRMGGILLANALHGSAMLDYVRDVVTASGEIELRERAPLPEEIGRPPGRSADGLVVRIVRGDRQLSFWDPGATVAEGDRLLVLCPGRDARAGAAA